MIVIGVLYLYLMLLFCLVESLSTFSVFVAAIAKEMRLKRDPIKFLSNFAVHPERQELSLWEALAFVSSLPNHQYTPVVLGWD